MGVDRDPKMLDEREDGSLGSDTNSERDRLWRGSCVIDFLLDSIIVSFFLYAFIDTLQ